jgi:hypothetical protein
LDVLAAAITSFGVPLFTSFGVPLCSYLFRRAFDKGFGCFCRPLAAPAFNSACDGSWRRGRHELRRLIKFGRPVLSQGSRRMPEATALKEAEVRKNAKAV